MKKEIYGEKNISTDEKRLILMPSESSSSSEFNDIVHDNVSIAKVVK